MPRQRSATRSLFMQFLLAFRTTWPGSQRPMLFILEWGPCTITLSQSPKWLTGFASLPVTTRSVISSTTCCLRPIIPIWYRGSCFQFFSSLIMGIFSGSWRNNQRPILHSDLTDAYNYPAIKQWKTLPKHKDHTMLMLHFFFTFSSVFHAVLFKSLSNDEWEPSAVPWVLFFPLYSPSHNRVLYTQPSSYCPLQRGRSEVN